MSTNKYRIHPFDLRMTADQSNFEKGLARIGGSL
jgi:hypothetical protein